MQEAIREVAVLVQQEVEKQVPVQVIQQVQVPQITVQEVPVLVQQEVGCDILFWRPHVSKLAL